MVIRVKFDDIPATSSPGGNNKKNSLFLWVLIGVIVLVVILIIYSVMSSNSKGKLEELDPNSRLVQSLYTSVHDFKSTSPYWMYEGENSSLIVNMTESNKLVLAYLNLKASDFLTPDSCELLPQENYYGKLVCSDKTLVKREDVERSYKEVFGDKAALNTAINMRVNPDSEIYIYNSDQDAYVLYSSATDSSEQKFSKAFKYNYNIYQAEKEGDTVRIYEELTVERTATGSLENQSKYLYTFVLGDDNMYSYTSIEKIA